MVVRPTRALGESLTSVRFLAPVLVSLGVLGLLFSMVMRNPYTVALPTAPIVGVVIFLAFRNRTSVQFPSNMVIMKATTVLYFIIFAVMIGTYTYAEYQRTVTVFGLNFVLYALAGLFCLTGQRSISGLALILLTGFATRAMAYYSSALYVGVDVFGHIAISMNIVTDGSLAVLTDNKYFYAPFFHLFTAVSDILLPVSMKGANALSTIVLATVVPALVIYCLVDSFWSEETALFGALLYTASDYGIFWGIHTIPTTHGIIFFSVALLTLIYYMLTRRLRYFLLFSLLLLSLTFTHQFSAFITIVCAVAIVGSYVLHHGQFRMATVNIVLVCLLTVFLDFFITKYRGPAGDATFFDVLLTQLIAAVMAGGTSPSSVVTLPNDPSISSLGAEGLTLLHVLGTTILVTLAIIGALYWLSDRSDRSVTFVGFAIGCVVTLAFGFTFSGPIVGIRNLLPFRWFGFLYVPLSLLAAPGLKYIIHRVPTSVPFSRRRSMVIICTIILLLYVGLMGGTLKGSPDNPLFDDAPMAERLSVTESESKLYQHTSLYTTDETRVLSDIRAGPPLGKIYGKSVEPIVIEYGNPDSIQAPGLILNREYLRTNNAQYYIKYKGSQLRIAGQFPIDEISLKKTSTVYDSGEHKLHKITGGE